MRDVRLSKPRTRLMSKTPAGTGGHQNLLRDLRAGSTMAASANMILHITPEQEERIRRYANDYGDGGYQRRFRAILEEMESGCRG